ncbi:MAG: hypothetical protein ACRDGW_01770 [Actinomycetota bacterium]
MRGGLRPARSAAAATAVIVAAMLTGSCSESRPADSGDGTIRVDATLVSVDQLQEAVTGLCLALDRLGSDPLASRDIFYDLSHDSLHTIAAAAEDVDRSAAASLLQAKAIVEANLDRSPFPPSLGSDLQRLVTTTRAALEVLSIPAPPCEP